MFELILDRYDQEVEARRLYKQLDDVETELAAVETKLAGARIVINHHQFNYQPRYVLPGDGLRNVSKTEMHRLQSRAAELRAILPRLQSERAMRKEGWTQCRLKLRDMAIELLLEAQLTVAQREEVEKEASCDDIFVQVDKDEMEVHVYFGHPNKKKHGHGVIRLVEGLLRLIYLRPRNESRGIHNIAQC